MYNEQKLIMQKLGKVDFYINHIMQIFGLVFFSSL